MLEGLDERDAYAWKGLELILLVLMIEIPSMAQPTG